MGKLYLFCLVTVATAIAATCQLQSCVKTPLLRSVVDNKSTANSYEVGASPRLRKSAGDLLMLASLSDSLGSDEDAPAAAVAAAAASVLPAGSRLPYDDRPEPLYMAAEPRPPSLEVPPTAGDDDSEVASVAVQTHTVTP